ncbi:Reticulon [Musa troglodytarum]|uniref:Reticulon n=1 Tax=Musa troglodytarum TaxID=320322 RepID=A0A9E7E8Y1_9LILI|nr:Reticulon [Musa troglodytarum]URD73101.1 Reticulon [Musa troglodytarum]
MAEHEEARAAESSLMEQIKEELHREDSSSSDSDNEKTSEPSAADAVKAKMYRLFGREKAVHLILGGGKQKKNKKNPIG